MSKRRTKAVVIARDLDDALSLMAAWLSEGDLQSIMGYDYIHLHEIEHFDPKHKALKKIKAIVKLAQKLSDKIYEVTKPLGY